jgi:hypothetical protein
MQSETKTMMENIEIRAGDINERGYLNGLSTKGFNHYKALLELCANSIIDAKAKKFTFEIKDTTILIIDDGVGMDIIKLSNMFSMHRENHKTDKSSGIAGVGGKIALMILSNKTLVEVFSFDGNNYIKAIVPWDLMFQQGKYTNMITIKSMDTEEIIWFKTKVNNTGTIIKFNTNETTLNTIESNFKITKDLVSNLNDYIYIVFGKYDGQIIYKNLNNKEEGAISLKTYNYFGENDNDYYLKKTKKIIIHYYNPKTEHSRYVYYDEKEKTFYEIKKKGAGYCKNPEQYSEKLDDYIEVCKYEVETGQRKDIMLFNEEDPNNDINKEYVDSASEKNCVYDKIIEDTISNGYAYFTKVPLYRNNQKIGDIEMTGHKASSARGNAESKHKMKNVRTEVSYSPVSYHGNIPDKIIGIQENKNQLESKDIPITLTRLIEHFHNEKANEIWNYFIQITPQKEDREKAEKEAKEAQEAQEKANREKREKEDKEKAAAAQKKLEEAEQKQVIDVCEKYIDYLKRNKNSKTIEIFKLQCELLDITP